MHIFSHFFLPAYKDLHWSIKIKNKSADEVSLIWNLMFIDAYIDIFSVQAHFLCFWLYNSFLLSAVLLSKDSVTCGQP